MLRGENTLFKDQIAQLKSEYSDKASQLEAALEGEQQKVKEKDELIAECEGLLEEFNN